MDDEFLRFEPVQFYRAFHGIPNKAGERQPAAFSNVRIEHPVPGHITVKVQGTRYFTPRPDGGRLDMIGRRYTPARCQALARAFYKIGLGLLYLDNPDFALSERFDEVRKVILGEVEAHGYLIIGRKSEGESEVRVLYQTGTIQGQPATAFEMSIFGLLVFFEMERRSLDPRLEAEARRLGHNVLPF